ncbi:hypothetical protein FNU76_23795 [Chitinimonas arctica]|uniref:Phage holin family protein n=1 Tax=Chitinimonas arctica TaxID=2594795 RepID=A0A516SM73_9NEIS|nr:putative holin [Chitinimonas arctica]QDQ27714.1 hypothetical protein FNU76_15900 [Chitinimonas arctica]QDQ29128.1 hypothetical protein FNU76_23795 [Chitinimonas arctica]
MAEPVTAATSSYAGTSLFAVSLISLFPGLQAEIVLGAFAGAIVFVLSSTELKLARKLGFFLVAFCAGCIGARMATSLIAFALPASITASPGVGALLLSAVAVKLLLWLIGQADKPLALLSAIQKRGAEK